MIRSLVQRLFLNAQHVHNVNKSYVTHSSVHTWPCVNNFRDWIEPMHRETKCQMKLATKILNIVVKSCFTTTLCSSVRTILNKKNIKSRLRKEGKKKQEKMKDVRSTTS